MLVLAQARQTDKRLGDLFWGPARQGGEEAVLQLESLETRNSLPVLLSGEKAKLISDNFGKTRKQKALSSL